MLAGGQAQRSVQEQEQGQMMGELVGPGRGLVFLVKERQAEPV
ncbi:hypothetical protein [Verrucomicrobium spinosum]|nr:hypothetical protein [Verrucomicrobium spinosum]